jgi:hypothetical protein
VKRTGWAMLLALVVAGVIVLLFGVIFPWVEQTFVSDPVLGALG